MQYEKIKELFTLLDLCASSLRRGHANLLCIVPILTDDPRRESEHVLANKRGANSIPILRDQLISSVFVSTDHAFRAIYNKWLNLKINCVNWGGQTLCVPQGGKIVGVPWTVVCPVRHVDGLPLPNG